MRQIDHLAAALRLNLPGRVSQQGVESRTRPGEDVGKLQLPVEESMPRRQIADNLIGALWRLEEVGGQGGIVDFVAGPEPDGAPGVEGFCESPQVRIGDDLLREDLRLTFGFVNRERVEPSKNRQGLVVNAFWSSPRW